MISYRSAEPSDHPSIRQLLAENGWESRVADGERFERMLGGADRKIVAIENDRVVGFARALCDGVSNGYIGTVVVAEGWRGRGVGRGLIENLTGDDPQITWVLRAGHGSNEFWEKMGFTRSSMAMERTRKT